MSRWDNCGLCDVRMQLITYRGPAVFYCEKCNTHQDSEGHIADPVRQIIHRRNVTDDLPESLEDYKKRVIKYYKEKEIINNATTFI